MFINKVGSLNKKNLDVFDTIEGTDIFNSKFIYELSNVSGKLFKITSCAGRLDLISDNCIGEYLNYGFNYVLNRITDNSSLELGKSIELLDENGISVIKTLV